MMFEPLRRAALLSAVVLGLAMVTTVDAAPDEKKAKKGKPQQVVPTGAEDAGAPATATEVQGEADTERMLDRSTEGLRSFQLQDGTVGVDLEGRFMHASMALKRADGSSVTSCVASPQDLAKAKAAAAATRQPAPPVALEEK